MKNIIRTSFAALAALAAFGPAVHAAPGSLDSTFNSGGRLVTSFGGGNSDDYANGVAVQADGKIVAAGASNKVGNYEFALARYTATGTLDSTFGTGGKVTSGFSANSDDHANGVAVQADGKILAAGDSNDAGKDDFALVRYTASGALDSTFGTGGKVTTAIGTGDDNGQAIALQPDGKILVAGASHVSGTYNFAVARYNTSGSLDSTFGTGGKVTTAIGTKDDHGQGVALQTDGKIVVAGFSNNGTDDDFALVRYNADGSLDSTFGAGGKVTTAIGSGQDVAQSVAISGSDQKIVAAGYSSNGTNLDFAVARYNTDGSLDTTFGTGGKVTTPINNDNDYGFGAALQADGKIVVGGATFNGSNFNFAVARYGTDGSLDSTFNSTGKETIAVSGSNASYAPALAVQPDGKIVLAGQASDGTSNDFALVRLTTTGTLDSAFNTTGKVTTNFATTSAGNSGASSIAVQADGNILLAGVAYNAGNASNDFAIARYGTDGSPDTNFSTDGKMMVSFLNPAQTAYLNDAVHGIALSGSDQKIVVAGESSGQFALARLGTDGSLDSAFGTDGTVRSAIGRRADSGAATAVQPDGKILVAGYSIAGYRFVIGLARYTASGALDVTFGRGGRVTTAVGAQASAYALAVQADGKIVVAGNYWNGSNYDIVLVRYFSNGAIDRSFGRRGIVTTNINSNNDTAYGMVIQPDGKILVAGDSNNGTRDVFALVRYYANGALDRTFGRRGIVTTGFGSGNAVGYGLALAPSGKIVVVGAYSTSKQSVFALACYNSNGSLMLPFGTDGRLTTLIFGTNDAAFCTAVQPDGKILAGGVSWDGKNFDFALARYTATQPDALISTGTGAPLGNNIYNSTGANQTQSATVAVSGGTATFHITIQNDGLGADSYTVKGTNGDASFSVQYFNGATDVTAAVLLGSYNTGSLATGASVTLDAKVTATTALAAQTHTFTVTATSDTDSSDTDTVGFSVTSK